jgi:hypothetical protein
VKDVGKGTNGFSNVVLSKKVVSDGKIEHKNGKSLNGNASVLDPTACEIILRMFMPKSGVRVYNPFGGGVQMGFVAGGCGFEYLSSEIRQNQCDANNAIWIFIILNGLNLIHLNLHQKKV